MWEGGLTPWGLFWAHHAGRGGVRQVPRRGEHLTGQNEGPDRSSGNRARVRWAWPNKQYKQTGIITFNDYHVNIVVLRVDLLGGSNGARK